MEDERRLQEGSEPRAEEETGPPDGRSGPGWRAWAVSIVVAVVLSAAATLLLGGDFRIGADRLAAGGCGTGAACCPQPAEVARQGR